ncbi:MAG TPA: hypothetical protein VF432_19230 [Thermoanaerobaculia bacterium]
MSDPSLQLAVEHERATLDRLPPPLPLAHLTVARWLTNILRIGEIQPRPCAVLRRDLLYLSYGGLFYRPTRISTQQVTELPIGLVFSPEALRLISSVFPFDTGAMATHASFAAWKDKFSPFETRFRLTTSDALRDTPSLVRLLYSDNSRYLRGEVTADAVRRAEPLPLLASFLGADLSPESDHRQRTIECVSEVALKLGQHLLWIGFPDLDTARVLRELYRWTQPNVPEFRAYSYHRNFNPAEIGAQLEAWANDAVIRRYAEMQP